MILPTYKTKKDGVPVLSNKQIEADVLLLIEQYNPELLKNPQPLDIEDFVENFIGFNVHYLDLTNNGSILGRMVFNKRKILAYDSEANDITYSPVDENTVVLDNSLLSGNEYLFRSTMGHECGHGIYHKQIFKKDDNQLSLFPEEEMSATVCRKRDILGSAQKGKRTLETLHDWTEHHANYFSAALLMNKSAMQVLCGDRALRERLRAEAPGWENEILAGYVSETFNVSKTSAKIRLNELDLEIKDYVATPTIFTLGYQNSFVSI